MRRELLNYINNRTAESAEMMQVFGIFGIVNYPIFYFVWNLLFHGTLESVGMRVIAFLLCTGLALKDWWPAVLRPFLPLYWYGTVLYCLPFFITYTYLIGHGSSSGLLNAVLGTFLLILVVDWISFMLLMVLGIALGGLYYYYTLGPIHVGFSDLMNTMMNMLWVMCVCIAFSYSREAREKERKSHIATIQALNASLEDKVAERTSALERALQAKTEFLNNISHEIRTPLQGISGISEGLALHWNEFDNAKRHALAKQVASNTIRLRHLVGHLLDLSTLSSGNMLFELQKVDMSRLVEEMIEECTTLYMSHKQIEIRTKTIGDCFAMVDKERMSQVLRNLFTNAIKFSPSGSTISAEIRLTMLTYEDGWRSEAVHFTLSDQGVGIPPDEAEAIFDSFYQSSRTKTKAGGSGLGLAICEDIIAAHQGRIWAEVKNDPGACFHFVIPVTQGEKAASVSMITQEAVQLSVPETKSQGTILMIDDEEACLMSMELLLHGSPYRLVKAAGGVAGLRYLHDHAGEVQLVLLDLMMPDIYGINVLAEMKHNPALMHIPVILQSGTSDGAEIQKALVMGVVAYIRKPYQKQVILKELGRFLPR